MGHVLFSVLGNDETQMYFNDNHRMKVSVLQLA